MWWNKIGKALTLKLKARSKFMIEPLRIGPILDKVLVGPATVSIDYSKELFQDAAEITIRYKHLAYYNRVFLAKLLDQDFPEVNARFCSGSKHWWVQEVLDYYLKELGQDRYDAISLDKPTRPITLTFKTWI